MFFFKNKGPKVRDTVYVNEIACAAAVSGWLQAHPQGRVGIWFQQDLDHFRSLPGLHEAERIVLAPRLSSVHLSPADVLFVGHYPLAIVEQALYDNLGIKEAVVYGHFDLPLMLRFGSERIKELMQRMGMEPNEAIEHKMISTSIKRAQDKIAEKAPADFPARSEAEWFRFAGIED